MKKNVPLVPNRWQQTFCNNPFYKKNVRNNRKYTNLSMKNNLWYGFILILSKKNTRYVCTCTWVRLKFFLEKSLSVKKLSIILEIDSNLVLCRGVHFIQCKFSCIIHMKKIHTVCWRHMHLNFWAQVPVLSSSLEFGVFQ